jgi:hypothetical protein
MAAMRALPLPAAALVLAVLLILPGLASASEPEAKDVARQSNCPPGKVEVLRRTPGGTPETLYRIACTGQKDVFVVVRCVERLCLMLRPERGQPAKPAGGR